MNYDVKIFARLTLNVIVSKSLPLKSALEAWLTEGVAALLN